MKIQGSWESGLAGRTYGSRMSMWELKQSMMKKDARVVAVRERLSVQRMVNVAVSVWVSIVGCWGRWGCWVGGVSVVVYVRGGRRGS
jgi:hypothetical protein